MQQNADVLFHASATEALLRCGDWDLRYRLKNQVTLLESIHALRSPSKAWSHMRARHMRQVLLQSKHLRQRPCSAASTIVWHIELAVMMSLTVIIAMIMMTVIPDLCADAVHTAQVYMSVEHFLAVF